MDQMLVLRWSAVGDFAGPPSRSATNPNAPGVSAGLVGIHRMLYVRFGRFYCKNLEEIAGSKQPPAWGYEADRSIAVIGGGMRVLGTDDI
jgi:hypothetical protein